jgi:hypothetical protein
MGYLVSESGQIILSEAGIPPVTENFPSPWVSNGFGAAVSGGSNSALTPAIPVAAIPGNLLLLATGTYMGTPSAPPLVAGWTLLTQNINEQSQALYGRIATGTGDAPSVNWNYAGTTAYAFTAAYDGNPWTLAGIVANGIDAEATNLNASEVVFSALNIPVPGCLVIAAGAKNKTAASNGLTFGALTNFTTEVQGNGGTGNNVAWVYNDWIQTTATNYAGGIQVTAPGDGSAQTCASYVIALLPPFVSTAPMVGVSGSAGVAALAGSTVGAIQAAGTSSASGSVALAPISGQLLGSGGWSMGVASLFSSVAGSIAAAGVSGSYGAAALTTVGGLNLTGIMGSSGTLNLTGNTPQLGGMGVSGSSGILSLGQIISGAMQAAGVSGSASGLFLYAQPFPVPVAPPGYAVMPNVVGQYLWEAIQMLQIAGVFNPQTLGYFGTYPISVVWTPLPPEPPNYPGPTAASLPFWVIAQSVLPNTVIKVNAPIILTAYEPDKAVAFP